MPITVGSPPAPSAAPGALEDYGDPAPLTVPSITGPATQQIIEGPGRWVGYSLIEPTGTTGATAELYDGMDVRSQLMAVFNIAVGGSAPLSIGNEGLLFTRGVFLNVITGTIRGVIWVRPRVTT